MAFRRLSLDRQGPIAEIRLLAPDRGKAVADLRLLDELDEAAGALSDDDAVHVALLTADSGVFPSVWRQGERIPPGRLPFRCLELMPQPVIACVEVNAYGVGLELVLACDLRIAAEGVSFALPHIATAAVAWAGATQRLPRLAGRSVALEMILLGQSIDAAAALSCGLANHVVPLAEVRECAARLASAIAERGPLAVRYAKEAVSRGLDMPLEQALRYETDLTVILQTTEDRAEGVRAFTEKRAPAFKGL
jgi:enoyl-CoA hydratase/carnithine racemase